MTNINTYWFTIATGNEYRKRAKHLVASLKKHHIELDVLGADSMDRIEAKYQKIMGILEAPSSCDRIVYLDADTLVINPIGIENVNGSWKIPWKIPTEGCIPKTLNQEKYIKKLESFYEQNNLSVFSNGNEFEGIEWNSGVIVGQRSLLIELAKEWAIWWDRIIDLFDGHFRRDQVSYRLAYYKVFKQKNLLNDLPVEYNWVVSYFGINPNANILHRTMVKNVDWLEKNWDFIAEQTISGKKTITKNKLFDLGAIQNVKPCLDACTHFDQQKANGYLHKALDYKKPKKVLIVEDQIENTCKLAIYEIKEYCQYIDYLDVTTNISEYDFIIFNSTKHSTFLEYLHLLDNKAVCCYFYGHNLEFHQHLFQFSYVRFVDCSFVVFSNSSEIVEWDFYQSNYHGILLNKRDYEVLMALELPLGEPIPSVLEVISTTFGFVVKNNHIIQLGLYRKNMTNLPEDVGRLKFLKVLSVCNNALASIPHSIGNLTSLEYLDFSSNFLRLLPESIGALKKLIKLNLSNNSLIELPESIGNLVGLKDISLYSNKLSCLPISIGNLKELIFMDLERNCLTYLPESFGNLIKLEKLWSNHNQLTNLPESIGKLISLKELYLYKNQLSTLPASIGNLKALELIDLKNNKISILPESIGNLAVLKKLNLWSNQLGSLPESFWNLKSLEVLNLRFNFFNSLSEKIGHLSNLKELYLDGNNFIDLPLSICNLTYLQTIKLNSNGLTILPENINNLKSLKKLWLRDNKLSSLPERFCDLPELAYLDLQLNCLDALPQKFGNLKSLLELWLDRNKLDTETLEFKEMIQNLQNQGCKVSY